MLIGWLEAIEIGGFFGYWQWKKRQQIKDDLYLRRSRPREIPVVDRFARRQVGNPSKLHKEVAQRVTQVTRFVVGTKAFEYFVLALVNNKSPLRKGKPKMKEVAITL